MKIVFVNSHLTIYGGGGIFLRDYANKFYEKGHDITIVVQKINRNLYKFDDKILCIEVGGPLPSSPFHWLQFKKIERKYHEVLNNLDSDIIISMYFPSNYFCIHVKNRNRLKLVNYCNEPFRYFHDKRFYSKAPFFYKFFSWILRIFFKKNDILGAIAADEIIYNSDFTRIRGIKYYNRDGYVHHIGVEINETSLKIDNFNLEKILNLEDGTPIIFTLGLSHHLKGVRDLMYIFHKILKEIPETILLIGGLIKKENKTIIKRLKKKLKIPQRNIICHGFIDDVLLNSFYAQSTLTFYTAIDEAFGLIPLESMKNGTPVIAFEGGPSETILDGQTGYVIKNYDLDDFAQKAIKLLRDKKLHENFSKKAKEHVKNNFSYTKCIPNLESILQEILSKS